MTAKEKLEETFFEGYPQHPYDSFDGHRIKDVCNLMKEFAQYHVEQALKEAAEKADAGCDFGNMSMKRGDLFATFAGNIGKVIMNKESILNAYPLKNIK